MLVAELKVGHVYRIRTDKPIHLNLHRGFIDIHTGAIVTGKQKNNLNHIA